MGRGGRLQGVARLVSHCRWSDSRLARCPQGKPCLPKCCYTCVSYIPMGSQHCPSGRGDPVSIAGSLAGRLASRTVLRGRTTSAIDMCWVVLRRVRAEGTPCGCLCGSEALLCVPDARGWWRSRARDATRSALERVSVHSKEAMQLVDEECGRVRYRLPHGASRARSLISGWGILSCRRGRRCAPLRRFLRQFMRGAVE